MATTATTRSTGPKGTDPATADKAAKAADRAAAAKKTAAAKKAAGTNPTAAAKKAPTASAATAAKKTAETKSPLAGTFSDQTPPATGPRQTPPTHTWFADEMKKAEASAPTTNAAAPGPKANAAQAKESSKRGFIRNAANHLVGDLARPAAAAAFQALVGSARSARSERAEGERGHGRLTGLGFQVFEGTLRGAGALKEDIKLGARSRFEAKGPMIGDAIAGVIVHELESLGVDAVKAAFRGIRALFSRVAHRSPEGAKASKKSDVDAASEAEEVPEMDAEQKEMFEALTALRSMGVVVDTPEGAGLNPNVPAEDLESVLKAMPDLPELIQKALRGRVEQLTVDAMVAAHSAQASEGAEAETAVRAQAEERAKQEAAPAS